MSRRRTTKDLTTIAILTALSSILFLIEIPIIAFYKLDLSNLPVLLGAFAIGPWAGAVILTLKDLIGMLHSTSMYVGELADLLAGLAFILPAAMLYRAGKTQKRAIWGMVIGTVVLIPVSVAINKFIMIPFFMNAYGMPMEAVVSMATAALPFVDTEWKLLLCVTAPFNLIKGIVISLITYFVYKPLSPMLHTGGTRK